jgi:hypothetical protein
VCNLSILKKNAFFCFPLVDQLEMDTFKQKSAKTDDILQNHRLNLEDVCLIFSSARIRSRKFLSSNTKPIKKEIFFA